MFKMRFKDLVKIFALAQITCSTVVAAMFYGPCCFPTASTKLWPRKNPNSETIVIKLGMRYCIVRVSTRAKFGEDAPSWSVAAIWWNSHPSVTFRTFLKFLYTCTKCPIVTVMAQMTWFGERICLFYNSHTNAPLLGSSYIKQRGISPNRIFPAQIAITTNQWNGQRQILSEISWRD